ncbi:putative TBP associated factor [Pseudovirgaria hyperparasitica]|uniref:TATA-binding protein-associated factor mot1 n=1 Tax=Pseudovirgaria hyperparasitica TaxID=470096 RepID=A0A6A6W7J3_9PEZI|nr:putative TBP associated factor [Pseudovirgaria hyperparasitica]KAF2757994.1 putative TBP associated factor [Pseudovirgaria hyperparasitica]
MASRLDRLVTLLETGSTPLIRNTAAQQLADVQKQHPDELFNLLTRVIPYLRSKNWDTRTAAAKAIGGIVDNAEKFDPNADDGDSTTKHESNGSNGSTIKKDEDEASLPLSDDQLQLSTLDCQSILKFGKPLLGSAGKEYDIKLAAMDPAQRLAHQKKSLTSRLGLGGEYNEEELITETDIAMQTPAIPRLDTSISRQDSISKPDGGSSPTPALATPIDENGNSLSKRQLNMLKRKAKKDLHQQANKVQVMDLGPRKMASDTPQTPASSHAATPHPVKQEIKREDSEDDPKDISDYFTLDRKGGDDDSKLVAEFKGLPPPEKSTIQTEAEERGDEWPYERLCEILTVDLFDQNWEIRHGAAMGLREVLRVHGAGAGRRQAKSRSQNDILNQRWLDDLACRICCVFMLDRFGDYVSDNVVAPIRETVGQTLGSLAQYLSLASVKGVYKILYSLVMEEKTKDTMRIWQASHGGMIGMRYLVAVRADLLLEDAELVDGILAAVMRGLSDFDDDVRAVGAATLIPVAREFVTLRPHKLDSLIHVVWECLSNLSDDLSASTGSVMDLLAKLCSFPEVLLAMKKNAAEDEEQSFAELVPRLYPFLRHTITSVRSAVLRALLTFLDIEGQGTTGWINAKALRLIYQNLLVERNEPVLKLSLQVWTALVDALSAQGPEVFAAEFGPIMDPLIRLTVHPIGVSRHPIPMEAALFIRPSGQTFSLPSHPSARKTSPPPEPVPAKRGRKKSSKGKDEPSPPESRHNIDGPMIQGDVDLVGVDVLIRSKIVSAQALGKAMAVWPAASRFEAFSKAVIPHLKSSKSSTQLIAAMITEEYGRAMSQADDLSRAFADELRPMIEDERPVYYEDLTSYLHVLRAQCQSLLNTFVEQGKIKSPPMIAAVVQGDPAANPKFAFGVADGEKLAGPDWDRLFKSMAPGARMTAQASLKTAREEVLIASKDARKVKEIRDTRIRAAAASAVVALQAVPKKPALTIRGMMDSVKKEENVELQKRSAAAIAKMIQHVAETGKRVIVEKVVGNLVKFYCMETAETPEFHPNADIGGGILSLRKEEDIRDHPDQVAFELAAKEARITRRGAREALEQLVGNYGGDLFNKIPILRTLIESPIHQTFSGADLPADIADSGSTLGQETVDGLSTLRALIGKFHPDLYGFVKELLPLITKALQSRLAVLRYAAAKCFATICSVMTVDAITMLVEKVLPSISNPVDLHCRQGSIECVYHLIHVMEDGILPYVIFLIVPVLGRMSDADNDVRLIATTTFATLVKLVPLEAGIPDPPGLSEELLKGREKERKFIAQMLDAKKVEPFEVPVAIKAELRSYQQEGVNWLAFLNRYHLHGILCDDMGLGKTLQTLCMVASDHHMRAEEHAKTQSPDSRRLPTLIICPPTLSGHWQQEIKTYAPFLTAAAYVGPPVERAKVRSRLQSVDIVITSYEIARNDSDVLRPLQWNYLVLDEGHLIKNSKAKTTVAVKQLASNHRLILSGTPIQNNVLELWSLFDFLMPGFLGTEKVFQDRFAKPIAASRFSKSSSKEQEAGALAIEALHKQVLPFLLRRLKEEVLNDLPPKILQNYYCDLSDLQKRLFENFTKTQGKAIAEQASASDKEAKKHIFQALQYMRKLCNSPAFVMKEGHKDYAQTQAYLRAQGTTLKDPVHAPKLMALRDLLVDCGIGAPSSDPTHGVTDIPSASSAVSQHRALIFCQMKEMLDMVQSEVLAKLLPSVQFLRMDGSVESSKRQDIVNKFNSDPSYDVLLLTTSVGGLGLNLTGADTVIFVEHDWNPQKDMQAMDRAHRIGQKKVVNVYRIVTRGTLEEKILSLQRFKIDVASTVVNQQNAGLGTMETDQILDLFNISTDSSADGPAAYQNQQDSDGALVNAEDAVDATGELREKGKKGFLDEIGELWDERQYEEEFNLDGFLKGMK